MPCLLFTINKVKIIRYGSKLLMIILLDKPHFKLKIEKQKKRYMEKEKISTQKKRGWVFFPALLAALLLCLGLDAQVTIGSGLPPLPGALLDLKENNATGANSVRGLNMPRVMLTDKQGLFPMFDRGTSDAITYKDQKGKSISRAVAESEHTGLTVYNVSQEAPFCPGLYVWDGTIWLRLGTECAGVAFISPNYNVNTGTTTLYVGAAFTGGTGDNLSRGTGATHTEMPAGVFRYTGGNGGPFEGYTATVEGIRIVIPAGTLATGAGELTVFVSGSPSALTAGKAFDIPVTVLGQQLFVRVSVGCGAYTGTPSIPSLSSDPAWLQFQCFNLGSDTNIDPFFWTSIGDKVDNDIKGYLFQWGRPADGHQKRTSQISNTLSASQTLGDVGFILAPGSPFDWLASGGNTTRWGDGSQNENMAKATNDPCPAGWKVPSQKQWNSIFRGGTAPGSATSNTWVWTGYGYQVGSSLYLPAAGHRHYYDGTLKFIGQSGYYWSSTVTGTNSYGLVFSSGNINTVSGEYRSMGFTVRCVRE